MFMLPQSSELGLVLERVSAFDTLKAGTSSELFAEATAQRAETVQDFPLKYPSPFKVIRSHCAAN